MRVVTDSVASHSEYWCRSTDEVLNALGSTTRGLSQEDAARRLSVSVGLTRRKASPVRLLAEQFRSPIMLLLAGSAGLSWFLDDATNAVILLGILFVSGLLSFWQEWGAADAVARLMGMIEIRTAVLRDGQPVELPRDRIVAGDVVLLRAGDLIPGDCRLLDGRTLFVNESVLTGESFPVEKTPASVPPATPLPRRTNALFLGTHVVSGSGTAVVVATGDSTEFGRISARLEHRPPETGFARGLRQFGTLLIRVVLTFTAVVCAIKVGWQGKPLVESLLVGLALAVGMTPQLLPAITSVVLSTGAKAMARRKVIVKQLLSIENLGGMTVLCSDKTGTLTTGEIAVQAALDLHGTPSQHVGECAYLNAALQSSFANPIDAALRQQSGFQVDGAVKLSELPYDFVRKRLSVSVDRNGRQVLLTKGALAHVLEVCKTARKGPESVVPLADVRAEIQSRFEAMSREGLRILGVAEKPHAGPDLTREDEAEMTFLGFVALADPPRPDAAALLGELQGLGIGLKIITGDNRAVAETISRRVGFEDPVILTSQDLHTLDDQMLSLRAQRVDVFAEIEPNQKERIIRALQRAGETVGYLGDGINDAPALHAADVGISVATAVDVAQDAASLVLLEQDLGVLSAGVREGRRTLANTLKYVYFAIAANFGYMFSLAVASLWLPFEPLLASQILLVNLLADFPAMALATDTVDPEQIERPRRWSVGYVTRFMLSFGLTSSLFDFLTFGALLTLYGGRDHELFRTGWFIESTLTGLMILGVIRTQRPFFLSRPGGLFLLAVAMIAMVTVALPYLPFAGSLGFVTPPPLLLAVTVGISLLYGIGMETVKQIFQRLHRNISD